MVKCLHEFEYFTVFLKNKNIIFKIRRSKVTDYAALSILDAKWANATGYREHYYRTLVKCAYRKTSFLISQPKHMLWVLKRTVSMRRLF